MIAAAIMSTACSSGLGTGSVTTQRVDSSTDVGRPGLVVPAPPDGLPIEVTRVSDGDSVRATSSEGDLEIRLIGINSPEAHECFGAESKAALTSLLGSSDAVLWPWPAEIDDFGRELAFLWVGDRFVNLEQLENGNAVARAQSDHQWTRDFEEAEQRAAEGGVGLWAVDACGPASATGLVIVEVEADAPGDDRQNPNGEWVVIRNDGDTAVDLRGWALRDESTRHRFEFPAVTLGPGDEARIRTGCGDDALDESPAELFWCDPEPPVWNNSGDTAFLLDENGNIADHLRS
ncbi:MAG: lamin tail domain-containing protein [Acidimicrobiales bacterium]